MKKINLVSIGLLSTFSIFVLVTLLSVSVYAQQSRYQDNMTGSDNSVKFLAIQHAESGSFSQSNATTFFLQLNNVSDNTILFSDRPERIVTFLPTSSYIGNWTIGQNNFASDPPNTAIAFENQTGSLHTVILELFDPVYDSANNILKYDVTTDDTTSLEIPSEFGQSTLIIDQMVCGWLCIVK